MGAEATEAKILAVCGKGGTGKTFFISTLAKVVMESEKRTNLLLIDADPAVNLPGATGVEVERTMGKIREDIINTAKHGSEDEKKQVANMVDYMALEALSEFENFSILAMGRTETLGCYCPVNNLLKETITKLANSFDIILIDGEAGLEQINRQIVGHVDKLVIVSDATERGVRTALQIADMTHEDRLICIEEIGIVFNRVEDGVELDALEKKTEKKGIPLIGTIPQDRNVASYDLTGKPLTDLPTDSPAVVAVREMAKKMNLII